MSADPSPPPLPSTDIRHLEVPAEEEGVTGVNGHAKEVPGTKDESVVAVHKGTNADEVTLEEDEK